MSARDELQQWVEGRPNTVGVQVDGKIYYSMDVDLARRVLAEMDATQATLAEVRELRDEYRAYLDNGQNQDDPTGIGPLLPAKGVVHALTAILDRSRP